MQKLGPPLWKRFFLGGLLALLHCALVVLVLVGIFISSDPEAAMGLAIFGIVDHPVLRLPGPFGLLIGGGVLWFCYGCILQSLIFIRRPGNRLRLAVSALLVGFLWTIPTIQLAMKPRWEAAWDRPRRSATAKARTRTRRSSTSPKPSRYSPKDNDQLPMLWDYLGSLYIDQENYPLAESLYRGRLAIAQAQPNPNPKDLLAAYEVLDTIYFRSGNIEGRKECLRKIIELSRMVKGGDSVQEAGAWQDLARITHDAGDPRGGADMLQRAITMYSAEHDQDVPYDYLNRTVKKWKTE